MQVSKTQKKQGKKELKHMYLFLCYLMVLQILRTTTKMLLFIEKSMMMIFRGLCLLTFIYSSCGDQTRKQGEKTKNKDKGKSHVVTIIGFRDLNEEFKECINNNSNGVNAIGSSVSTAGLNFTNSTNDFSAAAISSEVAKLKDMVRALLLDKKNQSSAPAPSPTPAPVKAVEPNYVTCGSTHSYQNCPATSRNVYRDNIQEYVSQAAAANYNQRNTSF
nr:hypothetical protein [Tanacetum cinerariifolium]